MSNNFHVNPKEEILNQMREELRERAKREFFLMEFDEIKRAVKYFKIIRKRRIGGTSDYCDLAINAMEKQIPKKPIVTSKGEEEYSGCPVCNKFVFDDYCQCCGQAIDWE
jgi:hypothetical protein